MWVHKKYTYSPSYNTLTLHLSPCCGYTKNIYTPRRTLHLLCTYVSPCCGYTKKIHTHRRTIHLLYTYRHVVGTQIYIYSPLYITLTLHFCIAMLWVHKKDTYSPSYNTLALHLSSCCGYTNIYILPVVHYTYFALIVMLWDHNIYILTLVQYTCFTLIATLWVQKKIYTPRRTLHLTLNVGNASYTIADIISARGVSDDDFDRPVISPTSISTNSQSIVRMYQGMHYFIQSSSSRHSLERFTVIKCRPWALTILICLVLLRSDTVPRGPPEILQSLQLACLRVLAPE